MVRDLSEIKLSVGNNLKLNLEDKKIGKLLIAGNTINFFGFVKDSNLDFMSMGEEDRKRYLWLLKRAIEKTEIYVIGEIEEKEYYIELFNVIEQQGIQVNWRYMETIVPKDYLNIIEKLKNMNFDACIMNPPYDRGLGDKFLAKTTEIVRHIVSIQPLAGMLYSRKNKTLLEALKKCDVKIQNLDDSEKIFDAGIGQLLGIYDVKSTSNPKFLLNGKDVTDIDALRWYSDDEHISAFNDIVKELYENDNLKLHIQNIKQNTNPEHKYAVKIAGIRGHKGADDFLSIVSNNEKFNQQKMYGEYEKLKDDQHFFFYISFDTEREMLNFVNYVKTDFARTCLSLNKVNLHLYVDTVPWLDFSEEIFSKSPREIDDYLFNKYIISDEIRKHIEEIIPDYYSIRKV